MIRDCGTFSVANLAIFVRFVGVDKTRIKEWTVVHLKKSREVKGRFSMDRVTIGDLLLEDKLVRMWRGRSSILFVGGSMHKVNVGPRVKIMGVVIVGEIILRTIIVNLIRSLACPTRWPTHNIIICKLKYYSCQCPYISYVIFLMIYNPLNLMKS